MKEADEIYNNKMNEVNNLPIYSHDELQEAKRKMGNSAGYFGLSFGILIGFLIALILIQLGVIRIIN